MGGSGNLPGDNYQTCPGAHTCAQGSPTVKVGLTPLPESWDFYLEFTGNFRQKGVKYAIKTVIYKSWDWFRPPPPSLGQNPNFYRKFVLKAPLIGLLFVIVYWAHGRVFECRQNKCISPYFFLLVCTKSAQSIYVKFVKILRFVDVDVDIS